MWMPTEEEWKEKVMKTLDKVPARNRAGRLIVLAALLAAIAAAPRAATKKTKPAEVPAKVIAHLPLPIPPGSQMVLQKEGSKQFLYIQQASKQGFTIIDVTKPEFPSIVNRAGRPNDAEGTLEVIGPNVALAEIPEKSTKTVTKSSEPLTETVKILDLSDPANPKTIQTFNGVTSMLPDGGRGVIYLTNKEGLWVLKHNREQLMPSRKKKPCDSAAAIASMPPDCE
jgi:hypothetical protein